MRHDNWNFLFLAALLLCWNRGQAQTGDSSQPTVKLPRVVTEVIVTDTKVAQNERNVTQRVNTVDGAEIESTVASNRNLTELLQYQPGVAVTVLSRNDANWGSFGGLGPKYNGFLLDGLPVDGFVDTMSLDAWALGRIESYQGPASVLYSNYPSSDFAGAQAPLAGVTNLILKEKIEAPATHVALGGGSWNTHNERFYHQDRAGALHYLFGLSYEQSEYTNYGTPNSWLGMLRDPAYQKAKFYGKASYLPEDGRQRLSFFYQHTLHDGDTGRPNRDFRHNYKTLNAAYSLAASEWLNVQLKAGLRNYDRRWGDDNYPASLALVDHAGVRQRIVPTDLTANWRHRGESLLTMGADAQQASYKTYVEASAPAQETNRASTWANGLFVQEKLVLEKLVLRAGARWQHTADQYELIGGVTPGVTGRSWDKGLWSAGLRYNASARLSLYGNAGSSSITPSAKAVGGTLRLSDTGVAGKNGQLPNPELKAESGLGSEFGVEFGFAKQGSVGVRGFFNVIRDAIVDNVVSASPSQTKSVNAGEARSCGMEIVYKQHFGERVRFFANYTRTHSRIDNPLDTDQDGSAVTFVPGFTASAGLDLLLKGGWKLSPYAHGTGRYYDSTSKSGRSVFGPYGVLNLKVEKPLRQTARSSTVLYADLNNVTHRRFSMPWQFRDPGFNLLGGVDFRF